MPFKLFIHHIFLQVQCHAPGEKGITVSVALLLRKTLERGAIMWVRFQGVCKWEDGRLKENEIISIIKKVGNPINGENCLTNESGRDMFSV